MGWLIDTSIWIAVERGTLGAADVHAITRQEPVYLSPVNIAEIQFGFELLPVGAQKQKVAAAADHGGNGGSLRITGREVEEGWPRPARSDQRPLACRTSDSA